MIQANNVTLRLGKRALFEDVNIKFTEGNCYGLIGANGAGKSTFLKILSGEIEPSKGDVSITSGQRLSVLKQDHYQYDDHIVLDTVMMGNQRLYEIMKEKEALYAKEDFTDEDGIRASELEGEFADMNGWEAESDAATLLNGLGIPSDIHYTKMADLNGSQKVKVLLAQALFGNPDILLLDEPTNHLDLDAIYWLEEFLINFDNTVIVVSHDRYFLNKVCTHIADIDYAKIQLFSGNYDFWYESSQLLIRQMKEANKKKEEKIKELQDFISRFSANASKSKQATSRKRALEKIQLDEIRPSSRKYPYIDFRPNREIGNEVLTVEGLSKTIDGEKILDNISFTLGREDKVAFVGGNEFAKSILFKILIGEMEPDEGTYKWGVTTSQAYFPKDFGGEFDNDYNITEWLTQYSEEKDVTYVRGFLGRMLFAGEDGVKRVRVLSGGEKVRCLLSKMMISGANVLLLDEPLGALDLKLRKQMQVELKRLQKKLGITFVYVTHDQEEALTMSDRIAVMHQGHFEQIGTAKEIYENPQTKFVASFIGESNIFEANVDTIEGTDLGLTMENGKVRAKGEGFVKEEIVYISVRPENTHLSDKPVDGFTLKGIVKDQIYVGSVLKTIVELPNGKEVKVNNHPDATVYPDGTAVSVYWEPDKAVVIHTKEDKMYDAIEDAVLK